jgi:IS30 family transposase
VRKVNTSTRHPKKCGRRLPLALIFFGQKVKEDKHITCRYFTYEDRKRLEELYAAGDTLSSIAATFGVHLATVYREINRGSTGDLDANGRAEYSAEVAQKAMLENLKRRGRKHGGEKQNE